MNLFLRNLIPVIFFFRSYPVCGCICCQVKHTAFCLSASRFEQYTLSPILHDPVLALMSLYIYIYTNVAFDPEHSWSSWPRGEKAHHFSHSRHCTCLFSAQSDAPILISPFDANKCKFQCESGRLAGCRKGWVSVS